MRGAQGDLEAALQDYSEAIRLDPGLAEAFMNRSVARKSAGDMEGALQDLNEAVRINPTAEKMIHDLEEALSARKQ